jgi:glutathione S-transferase
LANVGGGVRLDLGRMLGEQNYLADESISLANFLIAPQISFFIERPERTVWRRARLKARSSMQAKTWERVSEMAEAA